MNFNIDLLEFFYALLKNNCLIISINKKSISFCNNKFVHLKGRKEITNTNYDNNSKLKRKQKLYFRNFKK